MWAIGPIGFASPLLLLGLIALPILWLILRAIPPAPIRRRFPGVALLLGLMDEENQADRTPWWLLALRMLAIAAAIIGFAGPVLNPETEQPGNGPLLVVFDGTWADAPDWQRRIDRADFALEDAVRAGREVAVVALTDLPGDGELPFLSADAWRSQLPGLAPVAWEPDSETVTAWADGLSGTFDTLWLSDGLGYDWRPTVLEAFDAAGAVTVFESPGPVIGLKPVRYIDGTLDVAATRSRTTAATEVTVNAHGLDPAGTPRVLASLALDFAQGASEATGELVLPAELRNRVTRFEIAGLRSAGAVSLTDDALQRREIAVIAPIDEREGLQLLSPTHYLEQALIPNAELIEGAVPDLVLANPDVIVLADVARLAEGEGEALEGWVRKGGSLLRFAGPRLASSDVGRDAVEPLMPVRLRAGGRSVGGTMSWGEPKSLRAFQADSPFFGLVIPDDVAVSAQVMAQPDPTLAEATIASLDDGTPLVTRKRLDAGQVVLFHVTANAEWSSLPLSGLFVQMLERLAVSASAAAATAEDLAGTTWVPDQVLLADGRIEDAGTRPGVAGEDLVAAPLGPDLPPGLYSGDDRRIARNVIGDDTELLATVWPADVTVEGLAVVRPTPLKGLVLSLGLLALLIDVIASLWLSGRLTGPRAQAASVLLASLLFAAPHGVLAQDDAADLERALRAASDVTLAYVITGSPNIDRVSEAGLRGLSRALFSRTSVEPVEPTAINLETDDLSVIPFLYWPITPDQPRPSAEAYAKLNSYLRTGGMIMFDTRDA
ncbi:MAG: DUF4159 domain-containing protein, partial [Pseudomonadota bacterium]